MRESLKRPAAGGFVVCYFGGNRRKLLYTAEPGSLIAFARPNGIFIFFAVSQTRWKQKKKKIYKINFLFPTNRAGEGTRCWYSNIRVHIVHWSDFTDKGKNKRWWPINSKKPIQNQNRIYVYHENWRWWPFLLSLSKLKTSYIVLTVDQWSLENLWSLPYYRLIFPCLAISQRSEPEGNNNLIFNQ